MTSLLVLTYGGAALVSIAADKQSAASCTLSAKMHDHV